ncbi:hypothetical protein [Tenacibaculum sp. UWU-22]|uniref:hypothetical protein n=1 Tax=Tenacibaculum sp. UWU-22 TaxID=3234187 RepID=UPI0034DB1DBE
MLVRVVIFVLVLFCCTSCRFFTLKKESSSANLTDTTINFTKVDVSPSFTVCKNKIDEEKTACFRETIHQKIATSLAKHKFKIKDSINETISVTLLISSKGNIKIDTIISSKNIKTLLPKLDSLLYVSVAELPEVFPAIKRGIPVTTKYSLPIKIQLAEENK